MDPNQPKTYKGLTRANLFPQDNKLRRHGFRILSRTSGMVPLWERNGVRFTQDEALELADEEQQASTDHIRETREAGEERA